MEKCKWYGCLAGSGPQTQWLASSRRQWVTLLILDRRQVGAGVWSDGEAEVIVYSFEWDKMLRSEKTKTEFTLSFLSFFSSLFLSYREWRCNKRPSWKQWKTMPSTQQNSTKWLLSAVSCKGRQKSLTVEQKSGLQRHALACKHKSPSLSLDLWFPPSVVRSAAEPFPASLPHE